jgi:hypothetical protein
MKTTTRELIEKRAKVISQMRILAGDDSERNEYLDLLELENRKFKDHEDHKELNRLEVQTKRLEAETKLAELQAKGNGKSNQPIIWQGTARSWGEWVLETYRDGKIQATSQTNALELFAQYFATKDGKSFDPKSVLQNLSNKKNEGK